MYYCGAMRKTFTQKLFRWYSLYKRNLPWIGSNDPYKVWLSEVILQQTRVEQGLSYYQKFVKKYPDIQQLANAPHDEVMKMWEGLGYYSRARNMHSTAKQVVEELNSSFPDTYEGLIQLKGIGQYTAHAILSYAYKKPFAVVDGNVLRVLARYFGIREPIDTPKGKTLIQQHADSLLDKKEPDVFNQAMMDFGALICKPRQPDCENCPLQKSCAGYQQELTDILPVKSKKIKRQTRYLHFFVFRAGEKILVEQRIANDIWKNLYQFPVIETTKNVSSKSLMESEDYQAFRIKNPLPVITSPIFKQQLTHQQLICRLYIFDLKSIDKIKRSGVKQVTFTQLKQLAFPGVIRDFLKINDYF